jgi:ribosomal protein S18 acetylase RimI-like enzyme
MTQIHRARFPEHLDQVRSIFREYSQTLGIDLCFQGFESELATLPGRYAEPEGTVLLAWQQTEIIACGAIRPINSEIAEMKRLYVRPAGRNLGLGRQLAQQLCDFARQTGYRAIRLDTMSSMTAALALYQSLGFRDIPPYNFNPSPDVHYLELDLTITPSFTT